MSLSSGLMMKRRLNLKIVECLGNGGERVDKRREQSKSAARSRRRVEAEAYVDLAEVLPIVQPQSAVYQVDRIAVLRLAVTYYRLRELVTQTFHAFHKTPKFETNFGAETSLDCHLDGFLVIVGHTGHMLYVSETVSQYVGFTQADLMGRLFKDYVYAEESELITDELKQLAGNKEKLFFRMKTALTPRGGRSRKLTTAICQAMRATVTRVQHPSGKSGETSFYLHCVPVSTTHNRSHDFSHVLMSRHEVDMKFRFCEERLSNMLQYKNSKGLNGHSLYQFIHPEDLQHVARSFKLLYSKGHCTTDYYKLLTKNGHYLWVITDAFLMTQNVRGVHQKYVICSHQVLSSPITDTDSNLGDNVNNVITLDDCASPTKRCRLDKVENLAKFPAVKIKQEPDCNLNSIPCCSLNKINNSKILHTGRQSFCDSQWKSKFINQEDVKPDLSQLNFDFGPFDDTSAAWITSLFSLKNDFVCDDFSYLAPYVADDLLKLLNCEDIPVCFNSNFDFAGSLTVTKKDDSYLHKRHKKSSLMSSGSSSSFETSDYVPTCDEVFCRNEQDISNDQWKIALIKNDLVESAGKFLEMTPGY